MKRSKYLVALMTLALIAFSCGDGDDEYERQPIDDCIDWYRLVRIQNDISLDPFNVAYRLNLYLKESERDVSEAEAYKQMLFGGNLVSIEENGDVYTIKYADGVSIDNDYKRSGWIIIDTNGEEFDAGGSIWTVTSSNDNPYCIQTGIGVIEQRLSQSYTISVREDKEADYEWVVRAEEIYTRLKDIATNPSYWTTSVIITQTTGNISLNSLTSADGVQFKMELDQASGLQCGGPSLAMTDSGHNMRFKYTIDPESPVLYSSKCTFNLRGAGKERIVVQDATSMADTDWAMYDMGTRFDCPTTYQVSGMVGGVMVDETIYY